MGKRKQTSELVAEILERARAGKTVVTQLEKLLTRCQDEENKKAQAKAERGPRPLTDYQKFYKRIYPEVKAGNSGVEAAEIMRIISRLWQDQKAAVAAGESSDADSGAERGRGKSRDPSPAAKKAPAKKAAAKKK